MIQHPNGEDLCPLVPEGGWSDPERWVNVPTAYSDLVFDDQAEFTLLMYFILKSHNPGLKNSSWYGYRALQSKFKLGPCTVRRVTFILRYAGLVQIAKPGTVKNPSGKGYIKSNVYRYRELRIEDLKLFNDSILPAARAEYSRRYDTHGKMTREYCAEVGVEYGSGGRKKAKQRGKL